jgi:hypothetical protein
MDKQVIGVLMLAAAVLAGIIWISPRTTVIANEVSGEIYGIDFAGSLTGVDEISAQKRAAHKLNASPALH